MLLIPFCLIVKIFVRGKPGELSFSEALFRVVSEVVERVEGEKAGFHVLSDQGVGHFLQKKIRFKVYPAQNKLFTLNLINRKHFCMQSPIHLISITAILHSYHEAPNEYHQLQLHQKV